MLIIPESDQVDQIPEPPPKPELHSKKVMLSVWELLPANSTVTASVYTAQLERLKAKQKERGPGTRKVFFLYDNARPHVTMVNKPKLQKFDWAVLLLPPYSPDLAPTDASSVLVTFK